MCEQFFNMCKTKWKGKRLNLLANKKSFNPVTLLLNTLSEMDIEKVKKLARIGREMWEEKDFQSALSVTSDG